MAAAVFAVMSVITAVNTRFVAAIVAVAATTTAAEIENERGRRKPPFCHKEIEHLKKLKENIIAVHCSLLFLRK